MTTLHRNKAEYALGVLRLFLGGIFLWAFLDKLLGLGYATKGGNAWIKGGSPTEGFLTHGTKGPLAEFYQGLAGNAAVDALFMVGLLGIGLALLLGVGVRVAAVSGVAMMALMYLAALPPENNPVLDDHLVYAAALVAIGYAHAGRYLGLGERWVGLPFVARHPMLE